MMNLVYALIYGSIIILGLPLNVVSLWILLRNYGCTSPIAVFMVNLVISDLLLIISLSMRVYYYVKGAWLLGSMACICFTMLFRNNIRTSSIFITFISVDRLLAVVYPLRSRHLRTTSKAVRGVVIVWLVVLMVNVPESVGYLLVVNIVSTVMVSWTLNRRLNESAKVNNKMNVMLIFAMNLMMFIVFFLPVSLIVIFDHLRPLLSCLASVNCCVDPLLYYFSFDGFWKKKEDGEVSLARHESGNTKHREVELHRKSSGIT